MATVSVHNPHHSEGLLRQANRLRLAGTLCDVVISVQRQEYRAHSLVLACASRTLEEMFRSRSGRYSLDFLGSHVFERILEYAYTERLEVRLEELGELRQAATLLAMDGLEELILEVTSRLEDGAPAPSLAGNPRPDPTLPGPEGSPGIRTPRRPSFLLLPRAGTSQPRGTVITGPGSQRGAKGPRQPTPVRPLASLPPPGTVPLQAPTGLRPTPLPVQPHSPAYPLPLDPGSYPGNGAPGTPSPDGGARNSQQNGGIGLAFRGNSAVSEGPVRVESSTVHQRSQMETVTLFPCEFCGKRFLDSFRLQLHRRSHLGGLSMPIYLLCGKGLEMPVGVTPRAPGQGGASWRYSCRECQRLFPSLTALKRHLRSHHGDTGHQCQFCRHHFSDEAALRSHKQVHQGEKPYQCTHCNKKFSLKHQLETHYRVHTGEKPFECKLCHQRSRDYSAMIKHLRTHNGALPYRCTVCQEYCSSLSVMQKHIKTHLPEELPPDWSLEESYLYLCYL
ncbi:zinc finger and BTB domain-containing protein 16-A-like [Hemiscyllium ocellatum]|uniref:zinc finger and BTB domain-containing protein 16-A-like n=1 Tax=Hemiscyllium ocellatum TaxID=170820 RepID=UPI0029660ED8|nr:zinc finger and BTB domain-containing protein 16-A-like [Hemiscyllium ocellatum]